MIITTTTTVYCISTTTSTTIIKINRQTEPCQTYKGHALYNQCAYKSTSKLQVTDNKITYCRDHIVQCSVKIKSESNNHSV